MPNSEISYFSITALLICVELIDEIALLKNSHHARLELRSIRQPISQNETYSTAHTRISNALEEAQWLNTTFRLVSGHRS
jgi:hypothetical protein